MINAERTGWFAPVAIFLRSFGWSGVDLFFVLSGFLVGGILLKELDSTGRLDIGRFYLRRGFKIWPAYYAFIGVRVAIMMLATGLRQNWYPLAASLVFLQNFSWDWQIPGTQHTWSLCIEEHFYLILPLLLISAKYFSIRFLPLVVLTISFFCLVLRSFELLSGINVLNFVDHVNFWNNSFNRFDALMFGVLLAYWFGFDPAVWSRLQKKRRLIGLLGVILLAVNCSAGMQNDLTAARFTHSIGLTMTYLGYGCILMAMLMLSARSQARLAANLIGKLVAWIGFYSYSIYLWHLFFFPFFREHFTSPDKNTAVWLGYQLFYTMLAVSVGFVVAKLVEQPFLKMRDHLMTSKEINVLSSADQGSGEEGVSDRGLIATDGLQE
jgi:peptidoglycan/LPS O-acetylase OafA/YrhL